MEGERVEAGRARLKRLAILGLKNKIMKMAAKEREPVGQNETNCLRDVLDPGKNFSFKTSRREIEGHNTPTQTQKKKKKLQKTR